MTSSSSNLSPQDLLYILNDVSSVEVSWTDECYVQTNRFGNYVKVDELAQILLNITMKGTNYETNKVIVRCNNRILEIYIEADKKLSHHTYFSYFNLFYRLCFKGTIKTFANRYFPTYSIISDIAMPYRHLFRLTGPSLSDPGMPKNY